MRAGRRTRPHGTQSAVRFEIEAMDGAAAGAWDMDACHRPAGQRGTGALALDGDGDRFAAGTTGEIQNHLQFHHERLPLVQEVGIDHLTALDEPDEYPWAHNAGAAGHWRLERG